MSAEQEHEIVDAIRGWLGATSDADIPPGISREEARRRAQEFLAAIAAGTVVPNRMEADDDLKDVIWASVEELDERTLGQPTFEACDRFYHFVASLSVENDPFAERDEVLHCVARIGWRSFQGGLDAVLDVRATIWEHGDEQRHREICETVDELQGCIDAFGRERTPKVAETLELCSRLFKLCDIRPSLVALLASSLHESVDGLHAQYGYLDDREYLRASISFIGGCAARHTGNWMASLERHSDAAQAFRRTANLSDLERVDVERLALAFIRQDNHAVVQTAPTLIARLVVPRERVKAQLVFASALVSLDRLEEGKSLLEATEGDPVIEREPMFRIWLLTKLGTALSCLGREVDAVESFSASGEMLARFPDPMQMGSLAASIGEHLAKSSRLEEATVLYKKARDISRRIGQPQQVAYLSVLRAEILMLLGRDDEARVDLLAALPLIEKFDLRKEAVATVALLRAGLRKSRTDLTAIRDLRDQLRKGLH